MAHAPAFYHVGLVPLPPPLLPPGCRVTATLPSHSTPAIRPYPTKGAELLPSARWAHCPLNPVHSLSYRQCLSMGQGMLHVAAWLCAKKQYHAWLVMPCTISSTSLADTGSWEPCLQDVFYLNVTGGFSPLLAAVYPSHADLFL